MAQVELNQETGEFDAVVGSEVVTDISDHTELQEILEEQTDEEAAADVVETETDILDSVELTSLETEEETSSSEDTGSGDYSVSVASAVSTDYTFSPQAWQLNLASARQLGEHYLMYGVRKSGTSGYSSYWDYYLVLGNDIEYDESSDVYSYTDCDMYHYSSYDGYVTYDLSDTSGSISGSSSVVYSDLYFDYVGLDPVVNSSPYICFVMFMVLIIVILIGGRRNV